MQPQLDELLICGVGGNEHRDGGRRRLGALSQDWRGYRHAGSLVAMISVRPGGGAVRCSSTLGISGNSAWRRLLPARRTSTLRDTSGGTCSPTSTVTNAWKPLSAASRSNSLFLVPAQLRPVTVATACSAPK